MSEPIPLDVEDIPEGYVVRPYASPGDAVANGIPSGYVATCGACELSWDDETPTSMTPTPSARCPFEAFHQYEDLPTWADEPVNSMGNPLDLYELTERVNRAEAWLAYLAPASAELGAMPPAERPRLLLDPRPFIPPPDVETETLTFSVETWHLLADAADEVAEGIEGGDPDEVGNARAFRAVASDIRGRL